MVAESNTEVNEAIKARVEQSLESIRPYLKADGGDVKVIEITDDTAKIEMTGSCSSCPMSSMTLKAGVEQAILKAVPEIKKVIAVNVNIAEELF